MSFDEVIASRRSIRKFLDKKVDMSDVEEIIKAGIMAPSAHNRQPWKVAILEVEEKDDIASVLEDKADGDESKVNTARIIKEAPILLAIYYDDKDGNRDDDMLSIGAFIENMHLKATEMGYGSLWIANTNSIKEDINYISSVGYECVSCLAIGYKSQDPKMRPRKSLEEIIVS